MPSILLSVCPVFTSIGLLDRGPIVNGRPPALRPAHKARTSIGALMASVTFAATAIAESMFSASMM